MKIINFHIRGKMAHFRRYFSNSSALSYSVPPRTTIVGFIAGLLGYERDSYYDEFAPSLCGVAVGIRSPQKKKIQKLNLLMVKSANDLNGSQPFHSQTPTEIIMPVHIQNGFLDYEIWFYHQDHKIMANLQALLSLKYGYYTQGVAAALGTAQHLGWIEAGRLLEGEKIGQVKAPIHSIIPVAVIQKLNLAEHSEELHLQKEELPIHFHPDRTIASKTSFLVNTTAVPLKATVSRAIRLSDERTITWMEA